MAEITNPVSEPAVGTETAPAEGNAPAQETPPEQKKKKHLSPMHYPQRFIFHVILVIVMVWLLFGVFFGFTTAPNSDMYPRIDSGDLLLYYRLSKQPRQGDVIVFRKNQTEYVGRVVAVGGDTVEITEREQLKVNGYVVTENGIYYPTPRYDEYVRYPLTLAEHSYFVLVDYRTNGEDSRYFGPVREDEINGTVITVVRRTNL